MSVFALHQLRSTILDYLGKRRFLTEFVYAPGFYRPLLPQVVPNIQNVELCARACYLNPSCVGFQYSNSICETFTSLQGGDARAYIYLFKKFGQPGTDGKHLKLPGFILSRSPPVNNFCLLQITAECSKSILCRFIYPGKTSAPVQLRTWILLTCRGQGSTRNT